MEEMKRPGKDKTYRQLETDHDALQEEVRRLNLQIRAAEPVIGAARLMVKHMEDRHELSSCCHDVTPTNAYLLKRALQEWDVTQNTKPEKRVDAAPKQAPKCDHGNWIVDGDRDICGKCGSRANPVM